ncbi:putative sugar O-methyltransferase [Pelagibacterales bacterium SAG-MED41]|nr:putative sugar O-methyltransferase [Pelagibacterales bacterium SAG-MED41]|tara:strand:+ start:614 stop:1642 length:1029 start_codon:yes stop_codon:yes gene_type:complete
MIKLKVDENFKKRYLSYLSSDIFKNQNKISKTDYWEFFSKKFKYTIKGKILKIEGDSGFYYSEKNIFLSIKRIIKKIFDFFNPNKIRFLSYKKAFNKALLNKNVSKKKMFFNIEDCVAKNFKEIKKIYPFRNFYLDEHVIRSYYYLNIINNYCKISNINSVMEIGPGSCNLIALLKKHFNIKNFILIDLPETLSSTIPIIDYLFPKSNILFPHENSNKIDKSIIKKYDFIFLTPNQVNYLDENLIDLSINTDSFQEMNLDQVNIYLDLIQKVSNKNAYFFTKNRVEKTPFGSHKNNISINIKSTKFLDYKFHNNNIKFFEICNFSLDVQKHPMFIRLEEILK